LLAFSSFKLSPESRVW